MVATKGWADVSDVTVVDLARRFEDAGVAALLFTDVGRDGLLTAILDPHKEVAPQYIAYEVNTKDGNGYLGIINRDDATGLGLRVMGGACPNLGPATSVEPRSPRSSITCWAIWSENQADTVSLSIVPLSYKLTSTKFWEVVIVCVNSLMRFFSLPTRNVSRSVSFIFSSVAE